MSELLTAIPAKASDKRPEVERLLGEILQLMDCPARLDFKDADDGALGVAVHFLNDLPPGVTLGKRGFVVDSLQFLINKCVNRPQTERRWVNIGIGDFPTARVAKPVAALAPAAPPPAVAAVSADPAARPAATALRPARPARPLRPAAEEAPPDVKDDPVLAALGAQLAQKAAKHGRLYGVVGMSPEHRTQLMRGAQAVAEVTVKTEGESYLKRVVFTPSKPLPMPKKHQPVWEDEDDEE